MYCFIVSPPGGSARFGPLICLSDEVTGEIQGSCRNR